MATVLAALEHANIKLSLANAARKRWRIVEILKKFAGEHTAAGIGFSLLEDSSAFDAEFATPIGKELAAANKRLLVIILGGRPGSLEPAFLPPLLLFMRTVLDIPGFSFLAPFDSDIVAEKTSPIEPCLGQRRPVSREGLQFVKIYHSGSDHDQKSRFMIWQAP